MNRIVLIGNGFDLAHGLKTSYENFINWYWEQRVAGLHTVESKVSDDSLCKLSLLKGNSWSTYDYQNSVLSNKHEGLKLLSFMLDCKQGYNLEFQPFFKNIHQSIKSKRWVDIENEFFAILTEEKISMKDGIVYPDYKELNKQLDVLKNMLIDYLKLEEAKNTRIIDEINDKIYRPIKKREIAVANINYPVGRTKEEIQPSNIMLLNFNYTKTPEVYMTNHSNININYIHGRLNRSDSVIFGYGDDLDDSYKKLKNRNNNECLRNIKSIRYLESDNYRKMLEFIESAPFQICIMGHSCGNSDRTLLNTLFEHNFCTSIKPYYYVNDKGKDYYMEMVMNISRNFTDMKLMRDRVVNKEYCEPLTNSYKTE